MMKSARKTAEDFGIVEKKEKSILTCSYNIERMNSYRNKNDFSFRNGTYGKYGLYKDKSFPATKAITLYWPEHYVDKLMQKHYKTVVNWKRPYDLSQGYPSLWGRKGVLPEAARQGLLGDCWVLAVGSALAENPERVKKLFNNKEYSKEGIFQLNFYRNGKPI